ncbi:MAG: hypothetical protein JNK93_13025 [Planctomycetia bacterium]|nr:hypothetical protein [Planctomycetia bacterium]
MTDPQNEQPEKAAESSNAWNTGVTPDSDDQRPFPEVSEDWVDEQIRALLEAAHRNYGRTALPTPPPASDPST